MNDLRAIPENIAAIQTDIGLMVGYQTAELRQDVAALMQSRGAINDQLHALMRKMNDSVNPRGMTLVKQDIRAEIEKVLSHYFG